MKSKWEIDNFIENRAGILHIDGVSAIDFASKHDTPVFVYSSNRIRHNLNRLLKIQEVIDCRLKVCYAAKANSEHEILKVVRDAGCDLEVNSGGELEMAIAADFAGNRIIFNGTSKTREEINAALNADIYAIQADSAFELELIEECAVKKGRTANVSLRLVPEIESDTHSGLQTALLTSKFGMMPDEAVAALKRWLPGDKSINICGIHLHIGSQNPSSTPYQKALSILFENLKRIETETGHKLTHINIGGGFPVNYLRDDSHASMISPKQITLLSADYEPKDAIGAAWKTMKAAAVKADAIHLIEDIDLLIEPGRSVIADAAVCLTRVRNRKERPHQSSEFRVQSPESEGPTTGDTSNSDPDPPAANVKHETRSPKLNSDVWLLTDAGFNILLSMETYKWYYHLIHATRAGEPHTAKYKVAGPLCDGGDVYFDIEGKDRLPDYRLLPENVQPDELLALLNTGAYTVSQMFPYNGRTLPEVVVL